MDNPSLTRLMAATESKNQTDLATFLDLQPAAVAAGKKRGNLPPAWLITALQKKGVNPEWISTGKGPRYLIPAPEQSSDAAWEYAVPIILTNPEKLLSRLDLRELFLRQLDLKVLLSEAHKRCIDPQR